MNGPLKWHGGKHYLAKDIVKLMPPHTHYVEPYFGGGSVLFEKDPEGVSEVVNDKHRLLTNFWRVMQRPELFAHFERTVMCIPFSKPEFERAHEEMEFWLRSAEAGWPEPACVRAAVAFFVVCRQSMAGRMKAFAPLSRKRTRRGMNEQAAAWQSAVAGLPEVAARLMRVVVYNHDALTVIRGEDGPDTCFYIDPPYLHETRAAKKVYAHEMTAEQHSALLDQLCKVQGKFLLSGYRSGLYDSAAAAKKWRRVDFDVPNHAAGGEAKRVMTECVWCNF